LSALRIAKIEPSEAEALREIRLEAIRLNPTAFSRDLEVESAVPIEEWRKTLAERAWFVCKRDELWAGIALFARSSHSGKTAHIGSLGSMYVRAAFRGQGAGALLVSTVLDYAAGEVEQIVLTVNAENTTAIALYERHGFRTYGRIPRSVRVGERYYDELEMFRPLSLSD
jgi:ribosomal protein S18 acetylase RimI-like enzyme